MLKNTHPECAKSLVHDVREADKLEGKDRQRALNNAKRKFVRALGLEKNHRNYGTLASRTIAKYITSARKLLEESELRADDCRDKVKKAIKTYPEYADRFKALLSKKDIKKAWLAELSTKPEPMQYRRALNRLKLEHPMYYRIREAKQGSVLEAALTSKADADKKHIADKNLGRHKESGALTKGLARVSMEAIQRAVEEGLNPRQKHATKIAVALAICTGRRSIELFRTGVLKKTESCHTLLFKGQAKQKRKHVAEAYEIPVILTDSDTAIKALKRLRKTSMATNISDLDNEAVARRIGTTLSDAARASLFTVNISFHTCRAIYARLAYEEYRRNTEKSDTPLSEDGYRYTILGHEEDDVNTSQSYAGIEVDPEYTTAAAKEKYKEDTKKQRAIKAKDTGIKHPYLKKLKALKENLPAITSHKKTLQTRTDLTDFLLDACVKDSNFSLTASNIRKIRGGKMKPIYEYLELLGIESETAK